MPTICIQCSMRALLADEPPPMFDEEPEEHQARMHPDLVATKAERQQLEAELAEKLKHRHSH